MNRYVRLALVAATVAMGTVAPSANAACVENGPTRRIVAAQGPYGPVTVDIPSYIDTNPHHCLADAHNVLQEQNVQLPPL